MAAVLKKVSTGQGQPDIGPYSLFSAVRLPSVMVDFARLSAEGFRNLAEMQHSVRGNQIADILFSIRI
jgi:hypothetical protein